MHFLLALVIVAVVTLGVLFFGSVLLSQTAGPHGEIDGGLLASIAGISLAALVALGFLVDHNKVSPHYFYRDRLAETYLFTEVPDT